MDLEATFESKKQVRTDDHQVALSLNLQSPCNNSFDLVGDKCYKFLAQPLDAGSAQEHCFGLNAKLAEPLNKTELNLLTNYLVSRVATLDKRVLVGVTDMIKEDR